MKKKRNIDPLISQIELVLDLGQFISYNQSWDFVHDLEDIKNKIDELMESGCFGLADIRREKTGYYKLELFVKKSAFYDQYIKWSDIS